MLFGQCKKTTDPVVQPTTTTQDLQMIQNFFDSHKKQAETFTFSATSAQSITTNENSTLIVPPFVFIDNSGQPYTGDVTLTILEIKEPKDMILNNLPTTTIGGNFLESAGMFNIQAVDEQGNDLQVGDSAQLVLQIPVVNGQANPEMEGWNGDTTQNSTILGRDYQNNLATVTAPLILNGGVVWNADPDIQVTPQVTDYEVLIDSIGEWSNVDALMTFSGTKTTFFGYFDIYNDSTATTYQGISPSMLFFKPDGSNTLIKLYNVILNSPASYSGFHSYENSMPIGLSGTFLAITTKDGKFYAEKKVSAAIPAPSGTADYSFLNFALSEVTETQLLTMIQSM